MKKILFFLLLFSKFLIAQNISILSNEKIFDSGLHYYYPHLSPDGQKIAFTTQNFTGLYVADIKTKKILQISDKSGAGYEPIFSKDGNTIFFRSDEYEGIKKYSSILSFDIDKKKETVIENKKRNLLPPKIINDKPVYILEGKIKEKDIGLRNDVSTDEATLTYIENQKLIVIKNGKKTILTPKGEGNYIWPQLSPDKTKILFTFAGYGTYVTDLKGNILAELGYLNASKWLNNDWVVGMKDYDNGDVYTASDIFAVKADGKKIVQLTRTNDKIKMFPDCSSDGTKIVYHTLEGDIYLLTITYK